MLAKCANPACSAPFRYLHEGKLFRLDLGAGPPARSGHMPRQLQYFWLCERCARTMTLEMRGGEVTACLRPQRSAPGAWPALAA
jgi:hypothetical protein